jgi:hypothetical protein
MNELTQVLDYAIELIEEMKGYLDSGDHDSPQAFLEAAADVQHHINRAVHIALIPILSEKKWPN